MFIVFKGIPKLIIFINGAHVWPFSLLGFCCQCPNGTLRAPNNTCIPEEECVCTDECDAERVALRFNTALIYPLCKVLESTYQ